MQGIKRNKDRGLYEKGKKSGSSTGYWNPGSDR